jgi:hypothetical protein
MRRVNITHLLCGLFFAALCIVGALIGSGWSAFICGLVALVYFYQVEQ